MSPAITRNAAAYLGISNETGTLEPGKFADIVLIDGDPLADPMDLGNVKLVMRNGEVVLDARVSSLRHPTMPVSLKEE